MHAAKNDTDALSEVARLGDQLLAERDYGRAFMQHRIQRARSQRSEKQLVLGPARPSS